MFKNCYFSNFVTIFDFRFCMEKFGWNPDEGDGLMSAGGSMSNFYGMVKEFSSFERC